MNAVATEVDHEIPRRDIHFALGDKTDPDWFGGDAYRSAFCDALSVFFPPGERFFIRSVAHYLPQLADYPRLRQEIRGFMGQEALHTREHEAYNQRLREMGYPVDRMEQRAVDELAMVKLPLHQLAFTVALEHLTATLAHIVFRDGEIFAQAPEAYRELWNWHCLEEMEHKGVAFDVYRIVTADMSGWQRYALRCTALLLATLDIHRTLVINMRDILKTRGIFSWRGMFRMIWRYGVASPGYYRRALPYFLSYFLPGFDPWKAGGEEMAAKSWKQFFNQRAKPAKNT